MKTSAYDFTWTHPDQPQIDALIFARAHPMELPPEEVALCVFCALESEWVRNLKWMCTHPEMLGLPVELIMPVNHLLIEIIRMVALEWWQGKGWWPTIEAVRMDIRTGLDKFIPVFECMPSHFNMFTLQGLRIVHTLLGEPMEVVK